MSDLIDRQAAVDLLETGAEFLRRVLDDTDIVGSEREKFAWGLGLIESFVSDMKELPSAEPDLRGKCAGCFYVTGNYGACDFCMRNFPDRYSKG